VKRRPDSQESELIVESLAMAEQYYKKSNGPKGVPLLRTLLRLNDVNQKTARMAENRPNSKHGTI